MKACYDLKGCADDKLMEVMCLPQHAKPAGILEDTAILEIPHAKHWEEPSSIPQPQGCYFNIC